MEIDINRFDAEFVAAHRLTAERLPVLLAEAGRALDAPPTNGSVWRDAVAESLRQLETALRDDARREEAPNGFIAQSEREAPRFVHALEALRGEHGVLAAELAEARTRVVALGAAPDPDAVRAAVADLLRRIAHHVDAANWIAIEIADRDLGASD